MVGGLIGTVVMTGFQDAWSAIANARKNGRERSNAQRQQDERKQPVNGPEREDATMKAAGKIVRLTGRELSHEQKEKLGPLVHHSFGALQGAVYGAVTEKAGVRGGFLPAMIFGASLFVLADEIAVPAFGLSNGSGKAPLSAHLYGLASHLVYGASTEIARRGIRATLG